MLTAKDGEYDEADAFDLGADDYLTKPFSFVVLVARLRALARRGRRRGPASCGPATSPSTRARRRVHAGRATEIALTPREFAVLEHLVRNPDVALSKTAILRAVWDDDFDGDLNIVEIYVSYLRRKIDAPVRAVTSIRTVRGAGYLFSPDGG